MTQGTKLLGVIDLDSSEPLTVEERKALSLASMACLLEDGQLGKLGALISRYEAAVETAVEAERKACAEHYLALYRNASERREFELKILRERFDQLMTNFVQSQINPPVKLMADGESFEAGRVMEREACKKELETFRQQHAEAHRSTSVIFDVLLRISDMTDLGGEVAEYEDVLEAVKRIAPAEREACAAMVEEYMKETENMEVRGCLASVAHDIRARGKQ